ncbi:MAG: Antitoxin Phd YefM, type toxin-antitoxin system [Chloroflexota bacterium]|jgi:prevent-host-death family protein
MSHSWQLQEAKNTFSEVVARAEAGEVHIVTKHGVATAVVLSYAAYKIQ